MTTTYYVTATSSSPDARAAADYINRHAEAGGYTHDLREIEGEVASCATCIRDGLRIEIEEIEVWRAWLDDADGQVQFNVYPGEDVVEAGASALGVRVSEAVNVERVSA